MNGRGLPGHRATVQNPLLSALAALAIAGISLGCEPARPRTSAAVVEPTTCIGGLCVRPDHVVARKVAGPAGSRCMIVAWDGEGLVPPTARVAVTDESPAHPGIFLAVEVPRMLAGVPYRIVPNRESAGSALAVRVDPAVKFADHRVAEEGEVVLASAGDDMLVRVRTVWGAREETAILVVSKNTNGCGAPVRVD